MSEKLIVNWENYNNTVEKLAIQIEKSNYKPTILIGIMRGAAPMIDVLSRIFKLKCAYLAVESYSGKGVEDEQGNIVFSREMSSIAPNEHKLNFQGFVMKKYVNFVNTFMEKHFLNSTLPLRLRVRRESSP